MSAAFSIPRSVYKTDEQRAAFFSAAEEQLKNIPSVTNAALVDALPFTNAGGSSSFSIKGRVQASNDPGPHGNVRLISPDYFATLRIPLMRGRAFTSSDRMKTERVAIIDENLVHQYWPNEDPLGQAISFGDDLPWMTVVGIVKHAKTASLEADTREGFCYLPITQVTDNSAAVVVRTSAVIRRVCQGRCSGRFERWTRISRFTISRRWSSGWTIR